VSTLARTSLMRSSHAVVSNFASTFHIANTPALRTIALISLEQTNGTSVEKNKESRSSVVRTRGPARNHDLQGLFEVEDQKSPVSEQNGANQPNSVDPSAPERDSSTTSNSAVFPRDSEAAKPAEPIRSLQLTQETKKSISVNTPNATPVHHSNTAPYLGSVHSYMNDWENAPSSDIYTPPPDLRPWGSEDAPSWDDAANTKSNGDQIEKAAHRNSSRDETRKSSDTSEANLIISTMVKARLAIRPVEKRNKFRDNLFRHYAPLETSQILFPKVARQHPVPCWNPNTPRRPGRYQLQSLRAMRL
jgi:hypothetical protein